MSSKTELLKKGSDLLKPVMAANGFSFSLEGQGSGSGGDFAHGSWVKADRKLLYHFRYSLMTGRGGYKCSTGRRRW